MFQALAALDREGILDRAHWTVILNSDEEIGSPGSARVITQSSARADAGFVFELDELLNRAERLQSFNHDVGDPGYSATYLDRLRKRTPATVQAAARKWLQKPRLVVVTRPAPPAPPAKTDAKAPATSAPLAPGGVK
jgi:predicted Zn-dependent peptidase